MINFKNYKFNKFYPEYNIDEFGRGYLAIRNSEGVVIQHQYLKRNIRGNKMSKIIVPSQFVKADVNVFKGDVCIIRSEGKLEPSLDKTKSQWNFDLELPNGDVKSAKFNKVSIENLVAGFGTDEGKEWVGKEIVVDEVIVYPKGKGINWRVK